MIIAAMILSAPVQTTAAVPPPAVAPASGPTDGAAIKRYFACIREQTTFWEKDPAPATHVKSVMAACDPLVHAAAEAMAPQMLANPALATPAALYRAKHGHDVDLIPPLEHQFRVISARGAANILSGDKSQQSFHFDLRITADGVTEGDPFSPATTPAPAGDRPAAPASGTR